MTTTTQLGTRAVLRMIQPGSSVYCEHCGELVKFVARTRSYQAICNIYEDGRWDRVEHYHRACWDAAGQPWGPLDESQPMPRSSRGVL